MQQVHGKQKLLQQLLQTGQACWQAVAPAVAAPPWLQVSQNLSEVQPQVLRAFCTDMARIRVAAGVDAASCKCWQASMNIRDMPNVASLLPLAEGW